MGYVIAGVVIVVVIGIVVLLAASRGRSAPSASAKPGGVSPLPRPTVAEFHVGDGEARVCFEVPLPEGEVDEALGSLLADAAIEVVREKKHALPIGDVHRVVALGRRNGSWAVAATVALDTPGTLPPPVTREHAPHAPRVEFDVFDHFADLPQQSPRAGARPREESLGSLTGEMRLPARVAAALRAQGIDPSSAPSHEVVLGLMRSAGYGLDPAGPATYLAHKGGQRTLLRIVPHEEGQHPELSEQEVRRFVVDFAGSGASRGILITEKYSPFEIYERERRDPRIRFVTRERLQGFIDALALG